MKITRKTSVFFMLMMLVVFAHASYITSLKPNSLEVYPAKTELSKKAMQLKIGMTRDQVKNLLGEPTWAQNYQGMPLDWSYRNGNCEPVDVTFDQNMKVNGYDEGRASCLNTTYQQNLPDDSVLCINPKNATRCAIEG